MVGPERGLRPGKDPLWLDMAAVHTRPANRPDIPADAVDAIPMFKDKPASDEEQEQCSRQLTAQVCTSLWLYAHHCDCDCCCLVVLLQVELTSNALLMKVLTCYPAPNSLHRFTLYSCYLDVDVWLLQSACTCSELQLHFDQCNCCCLVVLFC